MTTTTNAPQSMEQENLLAYINLKVYSTTSEGTDLLHLLRECQCNDGFWLVDSIEIRNTSGENKGWAEVFFAGSEEEIDRRDEDEVRSVAQGVDDFWHSLVSALSDKYTTAGRGRRKRATDFDGIYKEISERVFAVDVTDSSERPIFAVENLDLESEYPAFRIAKESLHYERDCSSGFYKTGITRPFFTSRES